MIYTCLVVLVLIMVVRTDVRYGKSYDSEDEIKLRFEIFSDSLHLIRSTNRKALSYKLGLNCMSTFYLFSFGLFVSLCLFIFSHMFYFLCIKQILLTGPGRGLRIID